jgi:transcriptional regulator with XRE-family HTH domain
MTEPLHDSDVEESDVPFAQALTELKARSGMSFRELEQALDNSGIPISRSHLSALANGLARPSLRTMRRIAETFGKPATYFAEYRLAQHRALLDEGYESGLQAALAEVRKLPAETRRRAGARDPEHAPNAVPYRSGPNARIRSR